MTDPQITANGGDPTTAPTVPPVTAENQPADGTQSVQTDTNTQNQNGVQTAVPANTPEGDAGTQQVTSTAAPVDGTVYELRDGGTVTLHDNPPRLFIESGNQSWAGWLGGDDDSGDVHFDSLTDADNSAQLIEHLDRLGFRRVW